MALSKKMRILLYQGRGWVSKAIRWQTRSIYSHVAVQLDTGTVIEAWHIGGVRRISDPWEGHDPKTKIDFYDIDPEFNTKAVKTFLMQQIGKDYDFGAIARFLSRRDEPADDKYFCSELVLTAFSVGGLDLLHGRPSHLSPRDVSLSPYLRLAESRWRRSPGKQKPTDDWDKWL